MLDFVLCPDCSLYSVAKSRMSRPTVPESRRFSGAHNVLLSYPGVLSHQLSLGRQDSFLVGDHQGNLELTVVSFLPCPLRSSRP
jgi:hypothetical protein